MNNIIPVFFTFDKHYVVAAQVAIYSLLQHASTQYVYRLYVLHTDISPAAQRRMKALTARFPNASLEFIDAARFDDPRMVERKSHFSKEIYYKLIAAEVFPQYDRIICSDVDVVFTGDISPSYFMHPDTFFYFAGVGQIIENGRMATYQEAFTAEEIETLKKELSAGYMLLNLKAIREHGMQQQLTDFYKANYPRLKLPEQDCIILCCYPHVAPLPPAYVVTVNYYKEDPDTIVFFKDNSDLPASRDEAVQRFKEALAHPVQLHYVGANKPWNSFGVPKQAEWLRMACRSHSFSQYLCRLPAAFCRRIKRQYSLTRFLRKQINRLRTSAQ